MSILSKDLGDLEGDLSMTADEKNVWHCREGEIWSKDVCDQVLIAELL